MNVDAASASLDGSNQRRPGLAERMVDWTWVPLLDGC